MFSKENQARMEKLAASMPEGIKRAEIGWCCSVCGVAKLNQKNASTHNCVKSKKVWTDRINAHRL